MKELHVCMNKTITPDKVKLCIFKGINQTFTKANELFTTEFMVKTKLVGL